MVRAKEKSSGPVNCPACNHTLKSRKGLPLHLKSCSQWDLKFEVPYSEFDFDQYYQTGVWASDAQEGVDYVECYICRDSGTYHRRRRILDHVKAHHDLNKQEYLVKYPNAITTCSDTHQKRMATVNENWGVDNVFQAEEIKAKFDILETAWNPSSREKRAETNLAKYGHENPLGGDGGILRAKDGMMAKYGKASPVHVPEIQEKKYQTHLKKWGKWYTCTDNFKKKYRQTSQKNWGVDNWMLREESKDEIRLRLQELYGVDHPSRIPGIQDKIKEGNREKWGVDYSLQSEEVRAKGRATWMEKYGVDNPFKSEEIKEKIRATWVENYGVDNPSKSPDIREKVVATCLDRYGTAYPNNNIQSPNNFEQRISALAEDHESPDACRNTLQFTGDGTFWVQWSDTRRKNPDFVVVPEDFDGDLTCFQPTKVIEANGSYWHGPEMTGQTREEHESEMVSSYAQVGIECLVIWEDDFYENTEEVKNRLVDFLR